MKIISVGKAPIILKGVLEKACRNCGTNFECSNNDIISKETFGEDYFTDITYHVICPICKGSLCISELQIKSANGYFDNYFDD